MIVNHFVALITFSLKLSFKYFSPCYDVNLYSGLGFSRSKMKV